MDTDDKDAGSVPNPGPVLVNFAPRKALTVVSVRELYSKVHPDVVWLWDEWLPTDAFVSLSGSPKAGKSTFLYALLAALVRGTPFLGRHTRKTKVLVLGLEEGEREIRRHFHDNGIGYDDDIGLIQDRVTDYYSYIAALRDVVKGGNYGLVVIDTLSRLWQIENENDNAEASRRLGLLHSLCRETHTTILVIHHTRKEHFQQKEIGHGDMRGSQAIRAEFDVNLVYSRHGHGTLRRLKYEGRVTNDMPADMIVDYTGDGFEVVSTGGHLLEDKKIAAIMSFVEAHPETTTNKVYAKVRGKRETVRDLINKLVLKGRILRDSKGLLTAAPELHDPEGLTQEDQDEDFQDEPA